MIALFLMAAAAPAPWQISVSTCGLQETHIHVRSSLLAENRCYAEDGQFTPAHALDCSECGPETTLWVVGDTPAVSSAHIPIGPLISTVYGAVVAEMYQTVVGDPGAPTRAVITGVMDNVDVDIHLAGDVQAVSVGADAEDIVILDAAE